MSRHFIAATLTAAMLLTGCGTPAAGSLTTVKAPIANKVVSTAAAPTVNVLRGAAPVAPEQKLPAAPLKAPVVPNAPVSNLRVVGAVAMSDIELAEDAESQGFSLLAAGGNSDSKLGRPFTKTGLVRRTATGFTLEASKSLFKAKEKDNYTLTGATDILAQLGDRENKKAQIKGVVDNNNVVTVTGVKGLADMGFLTNWLSKGKITGLVTDDATDKALAGVSVSVRSADGFMFSAVTDEEGEFEVKSLTPGFYTVTMAKAGYVNATNEGTPEEVKKRTNVKFVGELQPIPAAAL